MVVLAAAVGWIMILWRLPHVRLASAEAKYTFGTLVFFTLAATFSVPFVVVRLDTVTHLAGTYLMVPYSFGIFAAATWAKACVRLEPGLGSRDWLAKMAPVAWLAVLSVWLLYLPEMGMSGDIEKSTGGLLMNTLLHVFGFTVVLTIAIPGLLRRIARQPIPAIRVRLGAILTTQIILALWLGSRMVLSPMIVMGLLPRTFSFDFINVLVGLMILAYSASLLPPSVIERYVTASERLGKWRTLYWAMRIERHIAGVLGRPALSLPAPEMLSSPDYALYRVTIAILDRRKALRQATSPAARGLAWQLDELTANATGYPDLVTRLHEVKLRRS